MVPGSKRYAFLYLNERWCSHVVWTTSGEKERWKQGEALHCNCRNSLINIKLKEDLE